MAERTAPGSRRIDRRGVAAFLAITFGLTWAVEIGALLSGLRFDTLTPAAIAILTGVMFIPALAAFVVRRFITREGFASAGLRLGPWRPYLAVWLGVPLLFALIYGVTLALGLPDFDPTAQTAIEQLQALAGPDAPAPPPTPVLLGGALLASLTFGVLLTSIATFGEEFGWTGFLLPKLLPLGRWAVALTYGAIWGLWHAPIIWGGYNYPGYPWIGVGMMPLFTISLALIQTALWLRSGSVLLTSFFHAAINTQGRGIWPLIVVGVAPLLGGPLGVVGILIFAATGAWLLLRAPRTEAERAA